MGNKSNRLVISHNSGGEVTLTKPLTVSSTIDVTKDLTINLNGHTITYSGEDTMFEVKNSATLTINGNNNNASTITTGESNNGACLANAVNAEATIIINGGNHTTDGKTAYKTAGGKIYIKKGEFRAAKSSTTEGVIHGTESNIFINGGTFLNWDPSENEAFKDDRLGILPYSANKTKYLNQLTYSDEYFRITKQEEGDNILYIVQRETPADNISDLNQVLGNPDIDKIVVPDGCDIDNKSQSIIINHDITIEGGTSSEIITGGSNSTASGRAYGFTISGECNVTIKNMIIDGGGCFIHSKANVTIENCDFNIKMPKTGGNAILATSNATVTVIDCNITVHTGTFQNSAGTNYTANDAQYYYNASGGTVEVYVNTNGRGVCKGARTSYALNSTANKVILYGGTYNVQPPTSNLAPGYITSKNGSTWTVVPDPNYAQ